MLGVRASAARIETGAQTREQVWVPTAALAPRLRIPLIASLAITLGPTLELSTQEVELTVGDSRLYRAAAVRVRGDVQAAFTF